MMTAQQQPRAALIQRLSLPLILLSALLLSACGFQLRGYTEIPDGLKQLYLDAPKQTATVRTLKRLLEANDIQLLSSNSGAPYQLSILNEEHQRRAISLSSAAKTEEYELRSSLTFQVTDEDGTVLIPATRIYNERVYRFDEDNVTAKGAEEALLREEMQNNLAQQLIRRYLSLANR